MPKACPVKELAPGKVLRLVTAPPIGAFPTEDDAIFAFNDTHTHQDAQLAEAMSGLMGSASASRLQVQPSNQWRRRIPAKPPVGAHQVPTVSGNIMVVETGESPKPPRTHAQV